MGVLATWMRASAGRTVHARRHHHQDLVRDDAERRLRHHARDRWRVREHEDCDGREVLVFELMIRRTGWIPTAASRPRSTGGGSPDARPRVRRPCVQGSAPRRAAGRVATTLAKDNRRGPAGPHAVVDRAPSRRSASSSSSANSPRGGLRRCRRRAHPLRLHARRVCGLGGNARYGARLRVAGRLPGLLRAQAGDSDRAPAAVDAPTEEWLRASRDRRPEAGSAAGRVCIRVAVQAQRSRRDRVAAGATRHGRRKDRRAGPRGTAWHMPSPARCGRKVGEPSARAAAAMNRTCRSIARSLCGLRTGPGPVCCSASLTVLPGAGPHAIVPRGSDEAVALRRRTADRGSCVQPWWSGAGRGTLGTRRGKHSELVKICRAGHLSATYP